MINIIIPMAGMGTRFAQFGYTAPKPLIEIQGHPFFFYSAASLTRFFPYAKLIFVGLQAHNPKGSLEKAVARYFPDAHLKLLEETPPGAVLTARQAIPFIDNDYPVLFNDCDHMFYSEQLRIAEKDFSALDGFLLTFKADSPAYSYCIKDENGKITGTVEKQVVGSDAIAGVYGFKNIALFEEASSQYLTQCSYAEFFMSGVYNMPQMKHVQNFEADFNTSFGTVEEYEKVKDSRLFGFYTPHGGGGVGHVSSINSLSFTLYRTCPADGPHPIYPKKLSQQSG